LEKRLNAATTGVSVAACVAIFSNDTELRWLAPYAGEFFASSSKN
jgi:hypothetical protein